MRLIGSIQDERQARQFSTFLKSKEIDNEIELSKNTDWGSADYASPVCRIWVIEEDDLDAAKEWWNLFADDPNDSRFTAPPSSLKPENESETTMKPPPLSETQMQARKLIAKTKAAQVKPLGPVTFYLLLVCILLFIFGKITAPPIVQPSPNLPFMPLYSPGINKELMYDYPEAYEIIDKLAKAYGIGKLAKPQDLPPVGKTLLQKLYQMPVWMGYYPLVVNGDISKEQHAPMFEKIREGEVWRLFTPALLHNDLFHLFFNMLWLLVLGRQMEEKLGVLKLILFVLIAGIFSNTAQYLMSGANFIGFSGILCAMIAFIWVRQRNAAWEGYNLQSGTINFIAIFILLMFLISFVSFLTEIYQGSSFGPNIANTAHLSGALIGYILGRTELFKKAS